MDKKIVYDEYSQLLSGIFHYQDHQIEIKISCIKILLGTFATIGLIAFANIDLSNLWFLVICTILPLLSLFFITINFFQDLVYKERLKLGFFKEAVKLEKENTWLPEFHKSLLGEANVHVLSVKKQISFYISCGAILFLISTFFAFLLPGFYNLYINTLFAAAFIILFFFYSVFIYIHAKKTKKLFSFHEKIEKRTLEKEKNNEFLSLLHARGKAFIEHFSNLKMRYKNFTIFLITAILIASAYIVASEAIFFEPSNGSFVGQKVNFVHENKIYLICLVTLLATIGIRLIRHLDINVSHEQIRLLFKCIINVEKKVKDLTKPYEVISQTLYQKNFDPIIIDFLYYASINVGIIILSLKILFAHIRDYHSTLGICISIIIVLSFFVWEIISFICIFRKKLFFKKNSHKII